MQSWEEIETHPTFKSYTPEQQGVVRKDYFTENIASHPSYQGYTPEQQKIVSDDFLGKKKPVDKDAPDFVPGLLRGIDQTQAMGYGAGALLGKGLKGLGAEDLGQSVQDWGLEGYRRNLQEAGEHAKKYSFKDVYTGEAGVGGAIDYVQGTLGELIPSMAEAAIGAAIGAAGGSAVGPGGTIGGGAIGAFAGRTVLKKAIDQGVKQAVKKGLGKVSESQIRKEITKQSLKKLGGKIGMGAAVMPMESGGSYAGLLEEHGVDAPETAMLFGALKTSLEFVGGNSKLVDVFVDAIGKGSAGMIKKSAGELLLNIPQEALQEGGQEVLDILNTVVNTDEKFLTIKNLEQVVESMGAGAVGGGAGAVVSSSMNAQASADTDSYEGQLKSKFDNIMSQGADKIPASINALKQQISKNQQLLQSTDPLDALSAESGYEAADITSFLTQQNEFNQELVTRLDAELQTPEQVTQDIETVIADQQAKEVVQDKVLVDEETSPFISEQQVGEQRQVDALGTLEQVEQDVQEVIGDATMPVDGETTQQGIVTPQAVETSPQDATGTLQPQPQAQPTEQLLQDEQGIANLQEQLQEQVTLPESGAETAFAEQLETRAELQAPTKVALADIQTMFPKQQVSQAEDGSVAVQFKNGKGVTFKSIQDAGQGFIKVAIETGQMSKNGKILGITVGNEVLLDANYADDKTMWHENKHVLDNLGMITKADDSALNAEFNKLRKAGKLGFALSTHEDAKQRMVENRANMFAQIMTDRAAYRGDSKFKAMIQRVTDFFQQMLAFGQQSVAGLSREVESGKLYERTDQTTDSTDPMFSAQNDSVAARAVSGLLNEKTDINTPEFAKWFDKSRARKADGSPLMLYHGTDQVFETFSKDGGSQTGHTTSPLGHFFTLNKGVANAYGQHTLPVYLKMNKPYKMTLQEAQALESVDDSAQRQQALRDAGYDSIVIETGADPYVIIFDSGQVKSVYNQGDFKAPENIYFETREQADASEQKLTDKQYDDSFNQKNNLVQNIWQTTKIRGHEAKLLVDKLVAPISTRLSNAAPMLKHKMRRLDFDTSQKIIDALHTAKPLLEKTKEMSPADKHAWDLARKQADEVKINQIADRYGMLEDMEKLRGVMNGIRQQAIDVGYDVGFIDDYWPRIIKDTEGFLQATQGISGQPIFTNAIKDKAKQMGLTVEELNREFPEVKADIISNMILGRSTGIGGPGNIQGRVFDVIPKEYEKFYMNSDAALMQYIYSMTKKIEARKFFGKVPPKIQAHKLAVTKAQAELNKIGDLDADRRAELNDLITLHEGALNKYKSQRDYTENIGAYIDDLMIRGELHKKDEQAVREILNARFNEHGTTGVVNAYKNMAYIDVMGSPISALTQIGDLAWAAYVGKAWTPKGFKNTTKNMINATLNKSKMTKEDLGLERIAQEFADGTTLGNAVSNVFKVVGLTKMDSIGKETLINNALMNYQDQVKTPEGLKALEKKIRPMFGAETKQVVKDLATGQHSDNVKMLIYSRLLDFQPAALSEMPEMYLKGGNGRVFYMLKTYTIKQMDVFRNEVFHELQSGDPKRVAQGIKNMVALTSMLTLANAGADELKDLVLGKEVKFKDNVIDSFLTLGGASRYKRMQITRDGLGTAVAKQILPPFKLINSAWADVSEKVTKGEIEKGMRSIDSIPGLGKLYYWHLGRGAEAKKTVLEKDFSKVSKKARKFKKQFEKAEDKRLFLQANPDEFKQMTLHQNFQTSVSGLTATINILKKIEQTPNVVKRIGQLENHKEVFYERYFEVAETLAQ